MQEVSLNVHGLSTTHAFTKRLRAAGIPFNVSANLDGYFTILCRDLTRKQEFLLLALESVKQTTVTISEITPAQQISERGA